MSLHSNPGYGLVARFSPSEGIGLPAVGATLAVALWPATGPQSGATHKGRPYITMLQPLHIG
jgi:hypothetical protein